MATKGLSGTVSDIIGYFRRKLQFFPPDELSGFPFELGITALGLKRARMLCEKIHVVWQYI